jgi:hypothetical protein
MAHKLSSTEKKKTKFAFCLFIAIGCIIVIYSSINLIRLHNIIEKNCNTTTLEEDRAYKISSVHYLQQYIQ